jgi:hypothetical protein
MVSVGVFSLPECCWKVVSGHGAAAEAASHGR